MDINQPSSAYGGQYHKPGGPGPSPSQAASSTAAAAGGLGSSAASGASGYTPSPGTGAGLQQYSEKLEKFREYLHGKGKSDAEISKDPEYLMMVEEEKRKHQQENAPDGYGSASGYGSSSAATTIAGNAPGYANGPPGSAKVDAGYGGGQRSGTPSSKKVPNVSRYDRVDLMASENYSSENQRAMEKLKNDGQQLLDWIKVHVHVHVDYCFRVWCMKIQ
jgi:hypothetical protein